jgi:hypothetical protein
MAHPPLQHLPLNHDHPELLCSICGSPVSLEKANTDENGTAVHEWCYLLAVKLKQATQ